MNSPQRGEVWLVDLGMAAKVRPAVAISLPSDATDQPLVTIIPHTTRPRGSRFEVAVALPFLPTGAFDVQNLITIPHSKLVRALGKVSGAQLASLERAVCLWIGLPATRSEV